MSGGSAGNAGNAATSGNAGNTAATGNAAHDPNAENTANEATPARRDELAAGLARVRERIAAAEVAAGRPAGSVGLVVVTKFHDVADVAALVELGVTDVGESRDDEAARKAAELAERFGARAPRIHFVGQVQTRKARSVAGYADLVHSLDRPKLAAALDKAAAADGRVLDVLVQVDLDDPQPADARAARASRGGVAPAEFDALVADVAARPALRLRGVMAVAPREGDPAPAFARLRELGARVAAEHPDADVVSAGMSGDLEAAIAAGSTLVRVGSAILGPRPTRG